MLRACIAGLLLVCGLVATPLAHAQQSDEEAHALFIAGEVAYGEGRYAAALDHFQHAYELSGRPLLLYNIGSSAEHLRHDAEALDAFERYLAETPGDAPDRAAVAARIEILRAELAAQASAPSPDPIAPAPTPTTESSPDVAPWIVLGIGGAFAIAGAVLLGVGYADASTFQGAARDSMWSSVAGAHDDAPILEGVGFALLGVGVAAAAAGVIWAVLPSGSSTHASAWLDGQSGGLVLRGAL